MKLNMIIATAAILLSCSFTNSHAQVVSVQTPRGGVYIDGGNNGSYGGRNYYNNGPRHRYSDRRFYNGNRRGWHRRGHVYRHGHRHGAHHRVYRRHRQCW